MSVRKRRGGQWYYRKWVKLPHGGRVRVFGTPREYGLSNTKAGCEEALRRKLREIIDGERVTSQAPSTCPTVSEYAPSYLEKCVLNNKGSTQETKQTLLERHIVPLLGDKRLDEIDFDAI